MLEKHNDKSKGLTDVSTIIIISSCQFTNAELLIYKKYEINFKLNMKKINYDTNKWKYITLLNENDQNIKKIKLIELADKININNIVVKLLDTSKKYNIDVSLLASCFSVKNEVPQIIKKKMTEAYNEYSNKNLKTADIVKSIYNISLCGVILDGRRRLMYKNVCSEFIR